jgi:hypothetical protein
MKYFIEKISDSEENDVIFINIQDKYTKKRTFKKMYKINYKIYKVDLEDNEEIKKFGTNESHNNFILL